MYTLAFARDIREYATGKTTQSILKIWERKPLILFFSFPFSLFFKRMEKLVRSVKE